MQHNIQSSVHSKKRFTKYRSQVSALVVAIVAVLTLDFANLSGVILLPTTLLLAFFVSRFTYALVGIGLLVSSALSIVLVDNDSIVTKNIAQLCFVLLLGCLIGVIKSTITTKELTMDSPITKTPSTPSTPIPRQSSVVLRSLPAAPQQTHSPLRQPMQRAKPNSARPSKLIQ